MEKKAVSRTMLTLLMLSIVVGFAPSFQVMGSPFEAFDYEDALLAPDLPSDLSENVATPSPSPGYLETSEYLIGDIAVGIIFLDSNGAIDPSTEDWTYARESQVVSEIRGGLSWLATYNPNAHVSFVYDIHYRVPTSYEPIKHPYWYQQYWISEAMTHLAYPGTYYWSQVRNYINNLRDIFNTDWAFAIFLVDSYYDADGKFTDGYAAYSYLGGPFLVMTYDNDGYGIGNMDWVSAHETAHIFYATDEYDNVVEYSGYLNAPDTQYTTSCLMGQPIIFLPWSICVNTQRQFGWRDSDDDGIQDIVDTFPNTVLNPYSPDPTINSTLKYTGSASEVPYPNHNPYGTGKNVTINVITRVEFRIDYGAWIKANATDNIFDEAVEDFTFITPPLSPGMHTIEARGFNSVGNAEITYSSDTVTILRVRSVLAVPTIVDPTKTPGSTFYIDITIADVSAMWGYQFLLYYDTKVLTATGYATYAPFNVEWNPTINDAAGHAFLAYSMKLGELVGFSTVTPKPIGRIDFSVDTLGTSKLDLVESVISDTHGNAIAHNEVDGSFSNVAILVFNDGFESGSFSAWTGTSISSGETVAVVNTLWHHSTLSAKFTSNGDSAPEMAYCYKTIASFTELYARGYFRVASSGIVNNDDRFYFIVFRAGGYGVAFAGWRKVVGIVKWDLVIREGTGWLHASSTSSPSLNQWYCVELHWKKDVASGLGELWVDGSKVCSITGKNTAALGDVNLVRFGLDIPKCGSILAYGDCAKMATAYIGPEPTVTSFTVMPNPFSPNDDGTKDTTTIRATFNVVVNWNLQVKTLADVVVRTWTGKSISLSIVWDGKDSAGVRVPDGTYNLRLSGADLFGVSFTSKWKQVTVDTKSPTVTGVSAYPTSFNPKIGQATKISYTLSESCYLTIKIYNSAGTLVRTLLNNALQTSGAHSVVWNGRNSTGNIVPTGKYTIKIWVVDKAGNRATPYPIIKTVTVL